MVNALHSTSKVDAYAWISDMVEIDYVAESRLRRRLHRRKYPDQRALVSPFRYLS
jgi:hypothetical protein